MSVLASFALLLACGPAAGQDMTIQDARLEYRPGQAIAVVNYSASEEFRRGPRRETMRLRLEPATDDVRLRVENVWQMLVPRDRDQGTLSLPLRDLHGVEAFDIFIVGHPVGHESDGRYTTVRSNIYRLTVPADVRRAFGPKADAPPATAERPAPQSPAPRPSVPPTPALGPLSGRPTWNPTIQHALATRRPDAASGYWRVRPSDEDRPERPTLELSDAKVVSDDFAGIVFAVAWRATGEAGEVTLVVEDADSDFTATHTLSAPVGAGERSFRLPLGIGYDGFTLAAVRDGKPLATGKRFTPTARRRQFFAGAQRGTTTVRAGPEGYTLEIKIDADGSLKKKVVQQRPAGLDVVEPSAAPPPPAVPPQPQRPPTVPRRPTPVDRKLAATVVETKHGGRFAPPLPDKPVATVEDAEVRSFGGDVLMTVSVARADKSAAGGLLGPLAEGQPEGRHWAWVCEYDTPNGRKVVSDADAGVPRAVRGSARKNLMLDVPLEYLRGYTVYMVTYPDDATAADAELTLVSDRLDRTVER